LNLQYNRLVEIPDCLGCLTRLEYLNLEGNRVERIPDSICNLINLIHLNLYGMRLTELPENIGNLVNLTELELEHNRLTRLPESLGNLIHLTRLDLEGSSLTSLPKNIGNLSKLSYLNLEENQLTDLPSSMGKLTELTDLNLEGNPLQDLSSLKNLSADREVLFLGVDLPQRYWTKFSEWKPQWLLEEDNAELRKVLIENVGYERICEELAAIEIDTWREYTLLRIEGNVDIEPILLLKMICPSTAHIHVLRVPPEIDSAESAITWINWGIHPSQIAIAT
jgi:leucine-rich repeat protein SHOC2